MSKFAPHGHRNKTAARATSSTVCQKCLGTGHYIYECKNSRPYISRPSRTQQLENPKRAERLRPSVEVPEEFKKKSGVADQLLADKEKARDKAKATNKDQPKSSKRVRRSHSDSESDSDSSSSDDSESDSSSNTSSSGSDSESDSDSDAGSRSSRSRDRRRKVPRRRNGSRSSSRS